MYFLSTEIHRYAHSYITAGAAAPMIGVTIGMRSAEGAIDIFNIVFIPGPIEAKRIVDRISSIQQVLPGNFGVVGLAYFHGGDQAEAEGSVEEVAGLLSRRLNLDGIAILAIPFNELIADRLDFGRLMGTPRWYDVDQETVEDQLDEGILWKRHSEMLSKRLTLRLRLSIPWMFNCQKAWDADEMEQEIRRQFERRLANLFAEKSYFVAFRNGENLVSMLSLKEDQATCNIIGSVSVKATMLELFDQLSGSRKRKELLMHQDVIDCFIMEKITNGKQSGDDSENEINIVPVVQYEAGEFLHFNIPQRFEIVVVCDQDDKVSDLPSKISEAYRMSVLSRLKQLLKYSDLKKKRLHILEPFVFLPSQCGHYAITDFPTGYKDEQLQTERLELHRLFGLPTDRPLFRKSNRFRFPHERGPYLIDVHEAVGDPGITATMSGLVSGHYQYRHYMQDNFDDKNWGCAYRSFQTIWSWFLLNGYTDKPAPSHREIQQALVDVGDKQPNFVGSRQWVGSLELSFCLDHLLGVSSKILSVTTGDEMCQKARELIHHFRTHGTPVMIGGGVLAHTILGVAYDEDSGDAMFLVLDPHYTGDENLKTIVDKGWCDWKPVAFWDKNSFYNMMLPIRPNSF